MGISLLPVAGRSQREAYGQSAAWGYLSRAGTAVRHYGVLHYCHSQSRSAYFPRASFVYAVEALEHLAEVFGRDARSVVCYGEFEVRAVFVARYHHPVCPYGIGEHIVHDVAEDAVYIGSIAVHDDALLAGASPPRMPSSSSCISTSSSTLLIMQRTSVGSCFMSRVASGFDSLLSVEMSCSSSTILLALCVASFEEVLTFVGRHVGVGEYALRIAVYAGGGGLQLVCRIPG